MFATTRGIVLHNQHYNDTYSIALVYTEEFGPVSYLLPRRRGKRGGNAQSFFYPLAILELEVDHKNLREIQRLRETKMAVTPVSLLDDPLKNAVCLFLAEFLGKVLREVHPDKQLFNFILQSIRILDLSERRYANFHLVFLIHLSRFLGFRPDASDFRKGSFFDLANGIFTPYKPRHNHTLNPDESAVLERLLRADYNNMSRYRFTGKDRRTIISYILDYYRLHLSHFSEVKSLEILHEVFG